MDAYTRSGLISASAGALVGAQGYTALGAVALSVLAGAMMVAGPNMFKPEPQEGRYPAVMTVMLAMGGWWVGSHFTRNARRT